MLYTRVGVEDSTRSVWRPNCFLNSVPEDGEKFGFEIERYIYKMISLTRMSQPIGSFKGRFNKYVKCN